MRAAPVVIGRKFSFTKGTTASITQGDDTLKITAKAEANFIARNNAENILYFRFLDNADDFDISLVRDGKTIIDGNISVAGSFILGENGAITVAKDTELQFDFGGGYVVDIKATDDAGGKISLGDDGINFIPNSNDGGLKISVTKDGVTRTTSLDVTGSIYYELDGTISLAKGSVIKNVFADGNELTITAKTDASGSIKFDPSKGLTITPSTPDALDIRLAFAVSGELGFKSITGTLNYNGGTITAYDGTSVFVTDESFGDYSFNLSVSGGTATVKYYLGQDSYTANDGATLTWNYFEGTTFELRKGTFTDIFSSETQDLTEILSAGSNFSCNNGEIPFILETKGAYIMNNINVITTSDNVKVQLIDNDTVIFDGITYTALDENVKITIGDTSAQISGGKIKIGTTGTDETFTFDTSKGSLTYDGSTKKFTGTNGATVLLQNDFKAVASDKFNFALQTAGDKLNLVLDDSKFSLTNGTRSATTSIAGNMTFGNDGSLSLENGTVVNLSWADGTKLQLNSHGSTGSIGFGDAGIKITSADENLDMTFTTSAMSTNISGIKGTLYYNAGVISFDENSKITATTTLGGQPILTTLETVGGTGHIDFNTTNGVLYAADTGALKVTWSRSDLESTFIVNSGSVQLGHNLFRITEGSDIATDLKNFVPAFYFTTSQAGTYTINGQTITTTSANLALTATDDQMVFKTSNNVVGYDGMTFTGNGNVSLKPEIVVLGAGVKATGFGEGNSFMLAEAGKVTVDAKIFEATSLKNKLDEDIPLDVSVSGTADGFTFSRVITRESEDYFNEPDYSNVGKIFREEFHSDDEAYRIHTDPIGLEEIIGITAPVTVNAAAEFDGEPEETIFDIVTDSEGVFTIGEEPYTIGGDSNVVIKAIYNTSMECARGFDSLNGTVGGDFTAHAVTINGGNPVWIFGDTDVSISANRRDFEIFGLDDGASVSVSAAGTYNVNGNAISAKANDFIVGTADGSALRLDSYVNNTVSNTLINGTDGDDYIINSGSNVTIDAGAGSNFVSLSGKSNTIVFNGNTTVNGFNFGFGDGSDTIYAEAYPAVDFYESGLTFFDDENSLTIKDVHTTSKINIYHRAKESLGSPLDTGVLIADNDWYSVKNGAAQYYVGVTGSRNHGVDFSGITSPVNATIETDYEDLNAPFWINGIGSIKGGDGLTTITGSALNDTILAGKGSTTINARGGDDFISLQSSAALVEYSAGDGNDFIDGFNSKSTLSILGGEYFSTASGDDVIISVDTNQITLNGAGNLSTLNIVGTSGNPVDIAKNVAGLDLTRSEILTVASDVKNVNLRGTDSAQVVSLDGGGFQIVQFNDEDSNVAITDRNADGWKNITFGDGADLGIFTSSQTTTRVTLDGNDSIVVANNARVEIDMTSSGAAKIIPYSGTAILDNYNASTGAAIQTRIDDIPTAIKNNSIKLFGDEIRLNSATVKVKGGNSTLVNLVDSFGDVQKVGFTGINGGILDASTETANLLLVGGNRSTLLGGSGNDTILAGAKDFVIAGEGKNLIELDGGGTKIGLDGGGNTTVHNFKTGFDSDSDALNSDGGLGIRLRLYDDYLVASVNGGAQVTLESVANDSDFAEILMFTDETESKVAVAKPGGTIKSSDAEIYLGRENAAVDFSGTTENLLVNLNNDQPAITGVRQKQFFGITRVAAGNGLSTLIGSDANETLIAGNGHGSIWGGSGDDLLIGKADSSLKNGQTSFFFFAGDGDDTVSNFEFVTRENRASGNADKIEILSDIVTRGTRSGDDVILQLNDGDDYLTIEDAAGKDFLLNNFIVKVDRNVVFDGLANCYVADGGSSLIVDSGVDDAEIWLDSSHGTLFFGNIRTLDASNAAGYTSLVGNEFDNTIIAGQNNSSLWGGNFGDDLLIGGDSQNTFFYYAGNGNDTIQGVNDGDVVKLADIFVEQITGSEILADSVTINLIDGGSLKITGSADITYQLADGSKYKANHESLTWQ